jgi:hypothetical protein
MYRSRRRLSKRRRLFVIAGRWIASGAARPKLPLESIRRLAAYPDAPRVHATQMMRRAEAGEVRQLVLASRGPVVDVMRVHRGPTAPVFLAVTVVASERAFLERAPLL